jgi:hypothetical protein
MVIGERGAGRGEREGRPTVRPPDRPTPFLAYAWAAPTSLLGLLFGLLALPGGRWRRVAGVLEASGGWLPRLLRLVPIGGGAAAMTLGHVVLGRDQTALDRTRAHERVHVRQAERWGPFFVPAYLLMAGWLVVRRKNPYLDHPFEAEARAGER